MNEMFSPDAHDSDLLNDDFLHSHGLELDHSFGLPTPLHDMQNDGKHHISEPDLANAWNSESNYHTGIDHRSSDQNGDAWDYKSSPDDALLDTTHQEQGKQDVPKLGSYNNPDGTVHYTSDGTDRDAQTGVIVRRWY